MTQTADLLTEADRLIYAAVDRLNEAWDQAAGGQRESIARGIAFLERAGLQVAQARRGPYASREGAQRT